MANSLKAADVGGQWHISRKRTTVLEQRSHGVMVAKIEYLAVNKGNILVIFYFLKYSSRNSVTYKSSYVSA